MLFIAAATLSACGNPPEPSFAEMQESQPRTGMAQVVFYYPPYVMGSSNSLIVGLGNHQVCNLKSGEYRAFDIVPGEHIISVWICGFSHPSRVKFTALPNKKYYIRVAPYDSSVTGVLSNYPTEIVPLGGTPHNGPVGIESAEAEAALEELRFMKKAKAMKQDGN